eukprot:gene6053-6755_t
MACADVTKLFDEKDVVRICAPMVRYSKLPFRTLVRRYGCDVAFTPMIISESFVQSVKARDSEFSTNFGDRPLIVQFAASNGKDLADATELILDYADAVDLNCGCPQRWAMAEGYGAHLIKYPDQISDMVQQVKNRVGDFPCSIKIRIHSDLRRTVDLCRKAEKAGVAWLSVHGRTTEQRNQPVNYEAIKLVKESVSVPVVANGNINSEHDVRKVKELTGVDGVMAAQGMLNNPAMYAGHDFTPLSCIRDWVDIALSLGTPFTAFHHHLMFMLEKVQSKPDRLVFNNLSSTTAVLDFLDRHYFQEQIGLV